MNEGERGWDNASSAGSWKEAKRWEKQKGENEFKCVCIAYSFFVQAASLSAPIWREHVLQQLKPQLLYHFSFSSFLMMMIISHSLFLSAWLTACICQRTLLRRNIPHRPLPSVTNRNWCSGLLPAVNLSLSHYLTCCCISLTAVLVSLPHICPLCMSFQSKFSAM